MDEKPTRRRGPMLWIAGRPWWFRVGVAIMLPFLYVASIGPVYWLDIREELHPRAASLIFEFYLPVYYLGQYGPQPVKDVLDWYCNEWCNAARRSLH